MPQLKTYDIFVSHAWKYGDDYNNLINLLEDASLFTYRNYSAPEHKPLIPSGMTVPDSKIIVAIENKIKPVNCFLVFAGMYSTYSTWIQVEIDIAKKYNKPIIGIRPWGQQVTPNNVSNVANEMVGWNTDSIVSAIRRHSI